ncbi:MAG: substrate-binding domain-containing protein [Candidatus Caenarcaniphilales bacterium]|jgi:phosphate transport system substrate-binding protein|nr:substrate-binding domain-containing protein [Candidatus Caenarcaniphilales bacterium]
MVISGVDIKKSIINSILDFSLNIDSHKKSGKFSINQISEMLAMAIEINNLINYLDKDPEKLRYVVNLVRPNLTLTDLKKIQRVLELTFKYNSDINSIAIDIGENLASTNRFLQKGVEYLIENIGKKDFKQIAQNTNAKPQPLPQTSYATKNPNPRPSTRPVSKQRPKPKAKGIGFFTFLMFLAILCLIGFFIYNMIFNQHATGVASLVKEYRSDRELSSVDRPDAVTKVLKVFGTKAVLNIFLDVKDKFDPAINYDIQGGDSGDAIRALVDGEISLAASSRIPTIAERKKAAAAGRELADHKIALDSVVFFVHPSNTMSLEEIKKIYVSPIITWQQAKSNSLSTSKIERLSLSKQSGTFAYFVERILYGEAATDKIIHLSSPEQMLEMVSSNPNAIGFASLSIFKSKDFDIANYKVKIIRISSDYDDKGTSPLDAAGNLDLNLVRGGEYPLTRYLYLISAGELDDSQARFIDFMRSKDAQAKLADYGLVGIY